jgi:hypothetical protein
MAPHAVWFRQAVQGQQLSRLLARPKAQQTEAVSETRRLLFLAVLARHEIDNRITVAMP